MKQFKLLCILFMLLLPASLFAVTGDPIVTGKQVNGLVDISGAAGGQIKFPATANVSADANTIDRYAEGTFSTSLFYGFTTVGGSGMAISNAYYTAIGGQVTFAFSISNPGGTMACTDTGNYINISGAPSSSDRGTFGCYNDSSGGHTGNGSFGPSQVRMPTVGATAGPLYCTGTYIIY